MAKIIFIHDGISFSDEGPTNEIMKVLIAYLGENNLRVENSTNERLVTNDTGALVRYSDRMIHEDSREFFGEFYVEV